MRMEIEPSALARLSLLKLEAKRPCCEWWDYGGGDQIHSGGQPSQAGVLAYHYCCFEVDSKGEHRCERPCTAHLHPHLVPVPLTLKQNEVCNAMS